MSDAIKICCNNIVLLHRSLRSKSPGGKCHRSRDNIRRPDDYCPSRRRRRSAGLAARHSGSGRVGARSRDHQAGYRTSAQDPGGRAHWSNLGCPPGVPRIRHKSATRSERRQDCSNGFQRPRTCPRSRIRCGRVGAKLRRITKAFARPRTRKVINVRSDRRGIDVQKPSFCARHWKVWTLRYAMRRKRHCARC